MTTLAPFSSAKTAFLGMAFLACILTPSYVLGDDSTMLFSVTTEQGVTIDMPNVGKITLPAPKLSISDTDYAGETPDVSMEDSTTLVAKYKEGDLELRITVQQESETITYTLSHPVDKGGLRVSMLLPIELNQGGKFAFNDEAWKEIPSAKPVSVDKKALEERDASKFRISTRSGTGFEIATPDSWQSLDDDRAYNYDKYEYHYLFDFKRYNTQVSFVLKFNSILPDSNPKTPATN